MTALVRRLNNRWPAQHDGIVRDWAAGRLTIQAAIAKSGLTKGQICGRAYRLKLPIASTAERKANGQAGPRPSRPAQQPTHPPDILAPPGPLFSDGCNWPSGDPGKPGWHFCGAPRVASKPPYCAAHVAKAETRRDA